MQLKSPDQVAVREDSDVAYLLDGLKSTQKVWFIENNGRVVGGIRIDTKSGATGLDVIGPNVVVGDLSIESSERKKGYGRELMLSFENWVLHQADLPKTISLAVETDNEPAIRLYESLGYRFLIESGQRLARPGDNDKQLWFMYTKLEPIVL